MTTARKVLSSRDLVTACQPKKKTRPPSRRSNHAWPNASLVVQQRGGGLSATYRWALASSAQSNFPSPTGMGSMDGLSQAYLVASHLPGGQAGSDRRSRVAFER